MSEQGAQHVKVYITAEKKEYYRFWKPNASKNLFKCYKCYSHPTNRKSVNAYFMTDENGIETFMLQDSPHICQPLNVNASDEVK